MPTLLKFTQGATTDAFGKAVVGTIGVAVVCTNSAGAQCRYKLSDRPPLSALVEGQFALGPDGTFTPDVTGGVYQVELYDLNNNLLDRRDFIVPTVSGDKIPGFKSNASTYNYGSNEDGWANDVANILRRVSTPAITSVATSLGVVTARGASTAARTGVLATQHAGLVGSTMVISRGALTDGDGGGAIYLWKTGAPPAGTDNGGKSIVPNTPAWVADGWWELYEAGGIPAKVFGSKWNNDAAAATANTIALQNWIDAIGDTTAVRGGAFEWPNEGAAYINDTLEIDRKSAVFRSAGSGKIGSQAALRWDGIAGIPMIEIKRCQALHAEFPRFIGKPAAKPSCALKLTATIGDSPANSANIYHRILIGGTFDGVGTTGFTNGVIIDGDNILNDQSQIRHLSVENVVDACVIIGQSQNTFWRFGTCVFNNAAIGIRNASRWVTIEDAFFATIVSCAELTNDGNLRFDKFGAEGCNQIAKGTSGSSLVINDGYFQSDVALLAAVSNRVIDISTGGFYLEIGSNFQFTRANAGWTPGLEKIRVRGTDVRVKVGPGVYWVDSTSNAWTNTTAYVVNDLVTNGRHQYICTVSGTSAGAGGPTGTGTGIVDGSVTWNHFNGDQAHLDVTTTNAGDTRQVWWLDNYNTWMHGDTTTLGEHTDFTGTVRMRGSAGSSQALATDSGNRILVGDSTRPLRLHAGAAVAIEFHENNVRTGYWIGGSLIMETANAVVRFGGSAEISGGAGTPEGAVAAGIGSLRLRTNGSTNTAGYLKVSGAGNIGWEGILTTSSPVGVAPETISPVVTSPYAATAARWKMISIEAPTLVESVTLTPGAANGDILIIKCQPGWPTVVTVTPDGIHTIDGAASFVFGGDGASYTFMWTEENTNWSVIAAYDGRGVHMKQREITLADLQGAGAVANKDFDFVGALPDHARLIPSMCEFEVITPAAAPGMNNAWLRLKKSGSADAQLINQGDLESIAGVYGPSGLYCNGVPQNPYAHRPTEALTANVEFTAALVNAATAGHFKVRVYYTVIK